MFVHPGKKKHRNSNLQKANGKIKKLRAWYTRKAPRERLIGELAKARSFGEWQNAAIKLDEVLGNDLWYVL